MMTREKWGSGKREAKVSRSALISLPERGLEDLERRGYLGATRLRDRWGPRPEMKTK